MAKQVAIPGATDWAHEWTVVGVMVDAVDVVAVFGAGKADAVADANVNESTAAPASVNSPRVTLRNVPPTHWNRAQWAGHPLV
jgi:hypothetical protein